jgi:hypothetical protein
MEGTPPLRGVPYPTFQCGQNVFIRPNQPERRVQNVFICPISLREGFKTFLFARSARTEGSKRFYSSNQPAGRVQNVFFCPISLREGFKTFLFAQSACGKGSKRFYSSKQPTGRLQNVFIRPIDPNGELEKRFYPQFDRKRR